MIDNVRVFMIPRNHEYIRRLSASLQKEGVRVELLRPFHYSTLSNLAKMLFFRHQDYKIVHVHWLYIFPFKFMMKWFGIICKMLRIKILWEIHNIIPHNYKRSDIDKARWFYERVDAVIYHSENDISRTRDILSTSVSKPYIVVPHCNFNESYKNTTTRSQARKILGIPDDKVVLLCFGNMRNNRGYEILIEATKDMDNVLVIVAGQPEEKNVYRRLQAQSTKITNLKLYANWIPDDEIQIYFNSCDMVVLPYTQITTSGVIPLSYAFRRPVISTSIGGIKDVVTDKTGMLVPPGNVKALREAIHKMLLAHLDKMGEAGYRFAQEALNWDGNASRIRALYEKLHE